MSLSREVLAVFVHLLFSSSKREGEVLGQLVIGASSKEAAIQLGISPRTIEIHRAHIMGKLGAKNVADLVRIVMSERRGS